MVEEVKSFGAGLRGDDSWSTTARTCFWYAEDLMPGFLAPPDSGSGLLQPVSVSSALFFESPVEIFAASIGAEIPPLIAIPAIDVNYKRFVDPNSRIRLESGRMTVAITDLLEGAPAPVTEALAHILLSKLYRKPVAR